MVCCVYIYIVYIEWHSVVWCGVVWCGVVYICGVVRCNIAEVYTLLCFYAHTYVYYINGPRNFLLINCSIMSSLLYMYVLLLDQIINEAMTPYSSAHHPSLHPRLSVSHCIPEILATPALNCWWEPCIRSWSTMHQRQSLR